MNKRTVTPSRATAADPSRRATKIPQRAAGPASDCTCVNVRTWFSAPLEEPVGQYAVGLVQKTADVVAHREQEVGLAKADVGQVDVQLLLQLRAEGLALAHVELGLQLVVDLVHHRARVLEPVDDGLGRVPQEALVERVVDVRAQTGLDPRLGAALAEMLLELGARELVDVHSYADLLQRRLDRDRECLGVGVAVPNLDR